MLDALAITEAEAAGLSELAALDLAMARDFAARAQAAEDPETANALARSYQRMARSYRQSLALKAKLRMETLAADRETPRRDAPAPARTPAPAFDAELRIDLRAEELHDAVQRVIWAEHERADPPETEAELDHRLDRLGALLERRMGQPGFADASLDEQVTAMCRALGLDLDLARRWRKLPEPDFAPQAADPPAERRGSG